MPTSKPTTSKTVAYNNEEYFIEQLDSDALGLVYYCRMYIGDVLMDFDENMSDQDLAEFMYRHKLPFHLVHKTIIALQKTIGKTDFNDYIANKYEGNAEQK